MRKLVSKLKKSAFVKNVLVVMSGSALAQIFSFALLPIISRLYSPAEFGVLGSFTAILGLFASGITLEYSQALILPKDQRDAFGLFIISCLSSLSIAFFCIAVCLLAPRFVINLMKAPSAWILVLLIVGISISGFIQTIQAWCIRVKAFKHTSASQIVRSLSANVAQIILGLLKGGALSLIFAVSLGDLMAALTMVKVVLREVKAQWRSIRWKQLWDLMKEYHDFPLYSASTNFIQSLSTGLPIFLLTKYFGISAAGAYAFGVRLIQAPMELILSALRQVLYQKASETYNEGGRLTPLYLKITISLFAVGLLPALILIIWAPQIFSWIFGPQWNTAGIFVRCLVLWLLFMFCNLPAILFTRILRMQNKMFFYNLALLIARALALIVGGMYLSASQTIFFFSLVGALMNIAYITIIGHALKNREGDKGFRDFLKGLKGEQILSIE